ncbi:MAG: pitrilysin family protein [Patescibacteria group bacterium]
MQLLKRFGVEAHESRLSNGMKVFLFKRKGMPISLDVSFFAGSRFDETPGTAHFLEHMLVAGTEKFPSKNLISDYLMEVGGDFGASTGNDTLKISIDIPEAIDLHRGIEVLNEMLANSIMSDKSLETERGSIFSEIADRKSHPGSYLWEVMRRLSLQGTDAAKSTLGTAESVKLINKKGLLKHKERYINTGRGVFVASGDIGMNRLCAQLEKISLPSSDRFQALKKLPIIREKIVDVEKYPGVEQLQVVLANRIDIENYREDCSLRILLSILGEGRGSRLITKLRYEKGLVYGISGSCMTAPDWDDFYVRLSCDKNNFESSKQAIAEVFENLRKNNITKEEFNRSKSALVKGAIPSFQTSYSWVRFHVYDALFEPDDMETPEDFIQEVSNLTLDDIKHVIDKFLKPEEFYTAICGDY